jgi:superfamily II DNA or RNA helicase
MLQLRPHQIATMDNLRMGFAMGHRAQMLYAPCGAGKTEIAVAMMDGSAKKNRRSAMLVDLKLLCAQTSARLSKYAIDHGIIQPESPRYRPELPIQVCMIQTLEARGGFPAVDVLVVDEAHTLRASVIEFVRNNPNVKVVGLSGSPFTKGLANTYTNVVSACTVNQLIDQGFLISPRIFISKQIDMDGAKKVAGEWSDKEATERGIKITGDVVAEWIAKTNEVFGGPKKTIVFCSGVAHGADLVQKFADAGFNFISVSYKDDDEYKRQVLEDFAKPDTEIHGLIATDLLTKGFDVTDVCVGVSARPFSKSFSAHVQQLGRIMRPHDSKDTAIWLDHCIAGDQRVLTHRGLVRIDTILLTDKIWDGSDFVTHKGVISRGKRPVISYAGITATPDHLVKTADEGWCSLGYCADKQKGIITTGIGRQEVRERDGYLTGRSVVGAKTSALHACALRVRHLWLSLSGVVGEFGKWKNEGLQTMQPAEARPGMVERQSRINAFSVQEQEKRDVPQLWWKGNRVQVRFSDFLRSLDSRELGIIGRLQGDGIGPHRQQRTLRAGEHSIPAKTGESQQYEKNEIRPINAQIHDRKPRYSIRGMYASAVAFCGAFFQGDSCPVSQEKQQAEREVWDILDCGPRNSFTCEGLLVHNSGNFLRFRDQWDSLCADGVTQLDDGAEKTKPEPTDVEKEKSKCPKCGCLWNSATDVCAHCGFVRARKNDVVAVAGEMTELSLVPKKEKYSAEYKSSFYAQLLGYAQEKNHNPGSAFHRYVEKFGVQPSMSKPSPQEPGPEVRSWIKSRLIAYSKRRKTA